MKLKYYLFQKIYVEFSTDPEGWILINDTKFVAFNGIKNVQENFLLDI